MLSIKDTRIVSAASLSTNTAPGTLEDYANQQIVLLGSCLHTCNSHFPETAQRTCTCPLVYAAL